MIKPPDSRYLVPFNGKFKLKKARTSGKRLTRNKHHLDLAVAEMRKLQRALYASDRHSLLIVFQGMDASGKDSTTRAVMQGINPAGCQVYSFKKPTSNELDHDFLWRIYRALPQRGRIGIFNRSHYEEVLVVRVHPGILDSQKLPGDVSRETIWEDRFESIRNFERHLALNGTVILKFWLNVSREEQRARFLSRLDEPDKQWKFNPADIEEREHWDAYMNAYQEALNATSREWAPWYAIPADSKPYMRATIAEIVVESLRAMGLEYPRPEKDLLVRFDEFRARLSEPDGK